MNNWWTDIRSSFKQQHQQQQQQQQQQKTIVKRPIMERCASLISELIDSWLIWKWPPYANELCYQAAAISLQAELFQAVSQQHPSALIGSLNCYSFIRELCRVSFFFVLFLFLFSFILIWNVFGALAAGQSATAEDEWLNRWDLIQIDRAFDFNLNSIAMASDCGPLFRDHQ